MNRREKEQLHLKMFILFSGILFIFITLFLSVFKEFDILVNSFFEDIQTNNGLIISKIISFFASELFVLIFSVIAIFIFKKDWRKIGFYLFAIAGGYLIQMLIKSLVGRNRPNNLLDIGFSYPSGHTIAGVLLYGSIIYFIRDSHKKTACFLMAVPFVIGLSRLYLGVHWFSDVLSGLLFGIFWICFSIYLFFYFGSIFKIKK